MTQANTANVVNRSDPVRREIVVPATGGNPVLISASIFTGYIEITEVPAIPYAGGAFTGQGCVYQRADENYVNTYPLPTGATLAIGDPILKNRSEGAPGWTFPDGSVRPATPFIKILSATGTATTVEVREWAQRGRS
jgi:hypothetical protein